MKINDLCQFFEIQKNICWFSYSIIENKILKLHREKTNTIYDFGSLLEHFRPKEIVL